MSRKKPNILWIVTDQQSAPMMSCAGNSWLHTPAMDRLAAEGVRFDRAYCTDPVCLPSRFSLMTGRMPSAVAVRSNRADHIEAVPDEINSTGIGRLLREAGYETFYGGKVHLPHMTPEDIGLESIERDERDALAETCTQFLRADHDDPFCLVASFVNPHDICYMAIRESMQDESERRLMEHGSVEVETLDRALQPPPGVDEEAFFAEHCPPLPANFEPQHDEPEAVRFLLDERPFRRRARERWGEAEWRMHRWAYCRLTERVDAQIGRVVDALEQSGRAEDTLVVFTSDHGDMDSAHRMEHKTVLYEEPCRVPLIVRPPGGRAAAVDEAHLVSNGLDLLPTLCDWAGAPVPDGLEGRSLRGLVEGDAPDHWRRVLPVESQIGRMVVTDRFKYMRYDVPEACEQMMDLEDSPREMRSVAGDPAFGEVLDEHRRLFDECFARIESARVLE